jgi:Ca2+-binding EF-hand superfamily protein
MDINEGLGASNNFIKLLSDKNLTQPEREKIKNDLKIYCKQDTQGMIDVLEYLKKIAKK